MIIKKNVLSMLIVIAFVASFSPVAVQASEVTTQAVAADEAAPHLKKQENVDLHGALVQGQGAHEGEAGDASSDSTAGHEVVDHHDEHAQEEQLHAQKEDVVAQSVLTAGPVEQSAHLVDAHAGQEKTLHMSMQGDAAQSEAMQRLYERLEKKVEEVESSAAAHKSSNKARHEEECITNKAKHTAKKKVHWSYSGPGGPEHWGSLSTQYTLCKTGKSQSPIDLRSHYFVSLDPLVFDYHHTDITVYDSGHDIGFEVQSGNFLRVNGQEYQLVGGHMHIPAEHFIEGRQPDMVLHLVHKDMNGRLAVVGVPFLVDRSDTARPNKAIDALLSNVPLDKSDKVWVFAERFDISYLLPAKKNRAQYFTYMGSLTTPPCGEGVLWMVMKHPLTLSRQQYQLLARLYSGTARPLQSLNGRLVKSGL